MDTAGADSINRGPGVVGPDRMGADPDAVGADGEDVTEMDVETMVGVDEADPDAVGTGTADAAGVGESAAGAGIMDA